mmetsp:Transcript_25030/g.28951  ORF Transcript_25030/g.28951 Transcript_25030/m.28951 type:complete len:103 (+) Transcript_25030:33-341(+)
MSTVLFSLFLITTTVVAAYFLFFVSSSLEDNICNKMKYQSNRTRNRFRNRTSQSITALHLYFLLILKQKLTITIFSSFLEIYLLQIERNCLFSLLYKEESSL